MELANYTSFGVFEPENNISIDIGGESYTGIQTIIMEELPSASSLDFQLSADIEGISLGSLRIPLSLF